MSGCLWMKREKNLANKQKIRKIVVKYLGTLRKNDIVRILAGIEELIRNLHLLLLR